MSTEEFIRRAREVHGDEYDYSRVEYLNSGRKVKIVCKIHGEFLQNPCNHITQKTRCGVCAHQTSNVDLFISRAKEVHGDRYDYSETKYSEDRAKLSIICKKHGTFWQTKAHHLEGKNCVSCCNRDMNTEKFIDRSRDIHCNRYSYENVVYTRSDLKVEITCHVHGNFNQQAGMHMQGQGCPKCAKSGYQVGKAGSFYILKSSNITKIGITNRDISIRLREINRHSPSKFELSLFIRFEDGMIPKKLEDVLLDKLSSKHSGVSNIYDGSTECFLDVDYDWLIKETTSLCSEFIPTK